MIGLELSNILINSLFAGLHNLRLEIPYPPFTVNPVLIDVQLRWTYPYQLQQPIHGRLFLKGHLLQTQINSLA
jgi:hypothetical protein